MILELHALACRRTGVGVALLTERAAQIPVRRARAGVAGKGMSGSGAERGVMTVEDVAAKTEKDISHIIYRIFSLTVERMLGRSCRAEDMHRPLESLGNACLPGRSNGNLSDVT